MSNVFHICSRVARLQLCTVLLLSALFVLGCGNDLRPTLGVATKPHGNEPAPAGDNSGPSGSQGDGNSRAVEPEPSASYEHPGSQVQEGHQFKTRPSDRSLALIESAAVIADPDLRVEIPVVRFQLVEADFAQILRCKATHRVRTLDGSKVQDVISQLSQSDPGAQESTRDALKEQMAWAWREATAASEACRIVALRALQGTFEEAGSNLLRESFYYVLNPCILDHEAPDDLAAAHCSNRLVVTRDLQLTDTQGDLDAEKREQTFEALSAYSAARSRTEGLATQLRVLAGRGERLIPICQKQHRREQALTVLWQGLGHLANIGVGAAIAQAPGLLAVPIIQGEVRKAVAALFARPSEVPPACTALAQVLDDTKEVGQQHGISLAELERQAGVIASLRTQGGN